MSILHTVNKSPFEKSSLDSCLKLAKAGSGVLLIEDGVYGALKGTAREAQIKEAAQNLKLYVLGPDLNARGMTGERVIDGIEIVDYAGFVDLAADHDKVNAWL
ncbi:sulfurtransferase complex subunit TusB [Sedimenticola thiotaurini]|jgi:tRNA 2-thiouridine synthesizing protein B|uniref:Sulfur relay protein TusB n=1 Tax=Sedimenticola thiotaurini TaxID=1543721 RepID=A0A0F7K2L6_9GAMM|nr:sulfurtransferase complex subunit TusB [Sedimenticola thiotaurini]AKH21809.1 sulfur relay protein TusB [Sedimenticola thiotaurini]